MTEETKSKMGITRRSFQKWGGIGGKIGGAKSVKKRFKGKSKKEISEIMKKVSSARKV